MKLLSLVFLSFIGPFTFAQLSFEVEWLTAENFFLQKKIYAKRIKTISIQRSDKEDNEVFTKEQNLAKYYFREDGTLSESQKFIAMKNRLDTSSFTWHKICDSRWRNCQRYSW